MWSGRLRRASLCAFLQLLMICVPKLLLAQDSGADPTVKILERKFAVNFLKDQRDIWTSPLKLKKTDLFWLAPSAAIFGEMLHRDTYTYTSLTPAVNTGARSKTFSDAGVIGMGGGVAAMYLFSRIKHNPHARETGILTTEALADSMTVMGVLKYSLQRDRPFNNNASGDFFVPNGGQSFPSAHAMAAWSMASVLAQEYPGWLTKVGVYGLATGISIARIPARQHFPTDVVVGSALGWGIGRLVYQKHHDNSLPGTFTGGRDRPEAPTRRDLGSSVVDLDSWIYPAIDLLVQRGYISSAFSSSRPWTRIECARLVDEAEGGYDEHPEADAVAHNLILSLKTEFARELDAPESGYLGLDELYSRFQDIQGQPLTDGFHFAQTQYNDYGRPFSNGFNAIAGLTASGNYSHWSFKLKGEYQHSPAMPDFPIAAQNAVAVQDQLPFTRSGGRNSIDRLRFIEAYAGYTVAGWELSMGKRALWWGPSPDSGFLFSTNAEPVNMVRLARILPAQLPSFLSFLGPMHAEAILGQLGGQQFVRIHPDASTSVLFGPELRRQPFVEGGRVSFKPSANFEFAVAFTTVLGSDGFPITTKTFLRSLGFSNTDPGFSNDPGDRRSAFDFSYRLPKLRDWLTLYLDSFTEDEISPLGYPRRSAMNPGLKIAKLPLLPRVQLRVEGIYTDIPNLRQIGSYFANSRFLSGYTNQGNIIGSWIGRDGTGYSGQLTVMAGGAKHFDVAYRDMRVNPGFLPQGGHVQDWTAEVAWSLPRRAQVILKMQTERWNVPLLAASPQFDNSAAVEFRYRPRLHF
jgi:membrane-associated phospholipid phosphatase